MAEGHINVHFDHLEQIYSLPNGARIKTVRLNPRIARTLMIVFDQCGLGRKDILSHDELPNHPLIKCKEKTTKSKKNKCRICGCTDDDCKVCIDAQGFPCHWVEDDLCSRCAGELESYEKPIIFARDELDDIYDSAVSDLEDSYKGNIEDIEDTDVANEPVEKFTGPAGRVRILQSIIKRIGGESI